MAQENYNRTERWAGGSGGPGHCVYRLVVPHMKIGVIIGKKGCKISSIRKETKAIVHISEPHTTTTDRLVLIYSQEDDRNAAKAAALSVLRLMLADARDFCSCRLILTETQASDTVLNSIAHNSGGASVSILPKERTPFYVSDDDRMLLLEGGFLPVLTAFEDMVTHLSTFLADESQIELFKQNYLHRLNQQEHLNRQEHLNQQEPVGSLTTEFPIAWKEAILGEDGSSNLSWMRRKSGANIVVPYVDVRDNQMTVEIKGTRSQTAEAIQLIQDSVNIYYQ